MLSYYKEISQYYKMSRVERGVSRRTRMAGHEMTTDHLFHSKPTIVLQGIFGTPIRRSLLQLHIYHPFHMVQFVCLLTNHILEDSF